MITYEVHIDEVNSRPAVVREILQYRRGSRGKPWRFLDFSNGVGEAVTNELEKVEDEKDLEREHILEGLKIAVDNIDEVIRIIRAAADTPPGPALLETVESFHRWAPFAPAPPKQGRPATPPRSSPRSACRSPGARRST